ncbi:hypothetical protein, partial [Enterobacter cloacae complex sp. 4DZ3-17B2]|uniref:hypothetical protein n=1 Tax=Enterobacter cloacae complex sp. 4DZ3-17B2 TaxID=2511990 RepID=UPI001CA4E60B
INVLEHLSCLKNRDLNSGLFYDHLNFSGTAYCKGDIRRLKIWLFWVSKIMDVCPISTSSQMYSKKISLIVLLVVNESIFV